MKQTLLITLALTYLAVGGQPNHAEFDALLKKYVDESGWVDYSGLKESKGELQAYIDILESDSPSDAWNEAQKKAFWLNAYNAYTLKLIIDNLPLKSIMDLDEPWDQEVAAINYRFYTLNNIEHDVLRKEFNDPRIHAGINCASFSCPRLSRTAFTEENVDELLERLMTEFVNDKKRNVVGDKQVELSQIFEWFNEDFTKEGKLIDFLNGYSEIPIDKKAKIKYLEYDWSLNGN